MIQNRIHQIPSNNSHSPIELKTLISQQDLILNYNILINEVMELILERSPIKLLQWQALIRQVEKLINRNYNVSSFRIRNKFLNQQQMDAYFEVIQNQIQIFLFSKWITHNQMNRVSHLRQSIQIQQNLEQNIKFNKFNYFQLKISSLKKQNQRNQQNQILQALFSKVQKQQQKQITHSLLKKMEKVEGQQQIKKNHEHKLLKSINHNLTQFLQNISHNTQLTEKQIQTIMQISMDQDYKKNISKVLSSVDIDAIKQIIYDFSSAYIKQENKKDEFIKCGTTLVQQNKQNIKLYTEILLSTLKSFNFIKLQSSNYFYLVKLFYQTFKQLAFTSTFAKKYLVNILKKIEKYETTQKVYLRGALRIFLNNDIQPSQFAYSLSKRQPQRSKSFNKSKESEYKMHKAQYIPQHHFLRKNNEAIFQILKKMNISSKPPQLQFIKLNCNDKCKTTTFCLNGFLSQNTNKDTQFQYLIQALRQSEIYAVRWNSCSKLQLGSHVVKIALSFGAAIGGLFGFSPLIGENVFTKAYNEAKTTGIYLAQFLITHFSDRYINLVGFSLGTRVIYCCLQHLKKLNKIHLINRIITLGGVADRNEIESFLQSIDHPISWDNFWTKKDFVITNILRLWDSNINPIGAGAIYEVRGHDVKNVDLTNQVSGHLKFADYYYGIGKMSDIYHE